LYKNERRINYQTTSNGVCLTDWMARTPLNLSEMNVWSEDFDEKMLRKNFLSIEKNFSLNFLFFFYQLSNLKCFFYNDIFCIEFTLIMSDEEEDILTLRYTLL